MIASGKLIALFERMLDEHWAYEHGAAREGCVDCSGAFVWAYKQLGEKIEHGSNSIAHLRVGAYVSVAEAKPGYAVFKMRPWSESEAGNRWMNQSPGDVYHIGLMGRDGKVLNAQGVKNGFVASSAAGWSFAAPLKAVAYTDEGGGESMAYGNATAKTQTAGSYVNLREGASTRAKVIGRVDDGTRVNIIREAGSGWVFVKLESGEAGYMSDNYLVEDDLTAADSNAESEKSETGAEKNGGDIYTENVEVSTTTLRRSDGVYITLAGKWTLAED